ncbi:MAG: PAS domain S-box protein [Acidobacteriota bacterium]
MHKTNWKTNLAPFLENFLEIILVVDLESGVVLESNDSARDLLGYSADDMRGRRFETLFSSRDEKTSEQFIDLVRAHGSSLCQRFKDKQGHDRWMDFRTTLISWQDSVAMLVTLSDAEDRVQQEMSQASQLAALEKATREIPRDSHVIPICMECSRLRTGCGSWLPVEDYLHQDAKFRLSHGICTACFEEVHASYLEAPEACSHGQGSTSDPVT